MKDEPLILKRRVINNTGSSSESLLCQCDISNFTKALQNFQREVRYISLAFFDFRNARAIDNASIYRFMNETSGAITKDVLDIQNILKNMSTAMEREKCKQKSIVADIFIRIFPKIKIVKNIAFFFVMLAFLKSWPHKITTQK